MNKLLGTLFALMMLSGALIAQAAVVSMDDEPHYSRVFANDVCKVYQITLGRLEETKPVAHEHYWVWISLTGRVTEAPGGTTFQSVGEPVGHEAGYSVHFRFPVQPYSLRNDHVNDYQGIVVEIMKPDESRYRAGDPSLNPVAGFLSPGDTDKSYLTSLVKTNVEVDNLQLLAGASQEILASGGGHLLVAMTDVDLRREAKGVPPMPIRLARGDVRWFPAAATATYTNAGNDPARFAVFKMR